ncbi:hypothetical protein MVEN_00128900 [Mycena venus]|uniref:BCS1 N-terminal domain-containing protein n=1 Tax=Mycena venus TaxID=2733690 RepID=A0A8H7DHQ4_9AGAR|nr:hypothetical protein MVEN_00128900 [Mycena venus]
MGSIVLDPGVKEMLLGDARDFLASEKVSFMPEFYEGWVRRCAGIGDATLCSRGGQLVRRLLDPLLAWVPPARRPGSGKSLLIHAIAGELMLDIYVFSLSSTWISDNVLTGLTGVRSSSSRTSTRRSRAPSRAQTTTVPQSRAPSSRPSAAHTISCGTATVMG